MNSGGARRRSALVVACGIGSWLALALLAGCDSQAQTATGPVLPSGIWISKAELAELPMQGPAWDALVREASRPALRPDLSNQDDPTNTRVLAKALVFARTGQPEYARQVEVALERVQGSEAGANSLAVSRELMAYVLAADLIGLDGAARDRFETWLRELRTQSFDGRTIRSTHEDRPNNWGTHAGATRLALAIYLADREEIEASAQVFKGWTGESPGWPGFKFGKTWWQPEGGRRYAVNPVGAIRDGHPIGGVLADDQRRGGRFRWPPPKENYVYEALQGATAQAVLLDRLGYDAWNWGDRALLRAFEWLAIEAKYPAAGDDTWMPHIVNRVYGASLPVQTPSRPGKAIGFSDWTSPARKPAPPAID